MAFKSDRRLCLTADKSRVVEPGEKGAGFLFATPGSEITEADVQTYGLKYLDGKVVLPQGGSKAAKKGDDKALKRGGDKAAPTRPPDRAKP